jgi:DNA-directed RNA polymerase specialized sigma24 family protein
MRDILSRGVESGLQDDALDDLLGLFQTAYWTVLNRRAAERLVGDTYAEAALRFQPQGEHPQALRLLLFRILARKALEATGGHPVDLVEDLGEPLAALSGWHRLLLVLSNVAGLGYSDISRVTGRRVDQIRADMASARDELRRRLSGGHATTAPYTV